MKLFRHLNYFSRKRTVRKVFSKSLLSTKIRIIYQLANLPISRKFFFLHLPLTFNIGTIQEERTISEGLAKKHRSIKSPI